MISTIPRTGYNALNDSVIATFVVAFYCRCSTEHEAQINALSAQVQWCRGLLTQHRNWTHDPAHMYVDEGITGTQAKKRDGFMRMMEEAKKGGFNLIVTREVCRFARNTVDALSYVRELKEYGVTVFFVNDNIWSTEPDSELRLTFMAAYAQEESRKVSERVYAGMAISRERGVLYGTGNILGYKRIKKSEEYPRGSYQIVPEEAETVRLIYSLYLFENLGMKKIASKLTELKRKNASGLIKWDSTMVRRVLTNKTYCGYVCYGKSKTVDNLTHKRVNITDMSQHQYIKADFPAIISETDFEAVQEKRMRASVKMPSNKGVNTFWTTSDPWARKLLCECGHRFGRNRWYSCKTSEREAYGYTCYSVKNHRGKDFREANNLDTEGYCDMPCIASWKLDFMLKKVLGKVWKQPWRTAKKLLATIEANYVEDEDNSVTALPNELEITRKEYDRQNEKLKTLLDMRLDGKLSDGVYYAKQTELEAILTELKAKITILTVDAPAEAVTESLDIKKTKLDKIKEILKSCTDFGKETVDARLMETFIEKVIPCDKGKRFCFYLNLFEGVSVGKTNDYYLCDSFEIGYQEAREYRKSMGAYLRSNQWSDLTVEIYIKV